jgi:hypothetical protein
MFKIGDGVVSNFMVGVGVVEAVAGNMVHCRFPNGWYCGENGSPECLSPAPPARDRLADLPSGSRFLMWGEDVSRVQEMVVTDIRGMGLVLCVDVDSGVGIYIGGTSLVASFSPSKGGK